VVLPLVFINVVLSSVDMLKLGKAGKVAGYVIGLYVLTTVMAAMIGILSVLMFKGFFIKTKLPEEKLGHFNIGCGIGGGDTGITSFMAMTKEGLTCMNSSTTVAASKDPSKTFQLVDLNGQFAQASGGGIATDISLSDTIYEGVFVKLISQNIVTDFASANFASIIFFAVVFGAAIHRATSNMQRDLDANKSQESRGEGGQETSKSVAVVTATTDACADACDCSIAATCGSGHITGLFREIEKVLLEMIGWILNATPFAVCSLVANAVGKQDNIGEALSNVGFLLAATFAGFAMHFLFVYVGLFFAVTRTSPLKYLSHLIPAQTMAFASASSAAVIPVNINCVIDSKLVQPYIAKFVIPLGATLNMDGGAVYFSLATIFLAVTSGLEDQITPASYILLVIIATIGSAGTAPVPSASLVLIITAYNTIFNTTGTPPTFSFILAIDWLLDRARTTLNVTGDAVVARLVSCLMERDATAERAKEVEPSQLERDVELDV
jgi:Na+/H+-dicarboxylate symporter